MADKRYEYEITADVAQFRRSMEQVARDAQESARNVGASFKNAERDLGSLTGMASGLRNVLGGALSAGAIIQFGRAVADSTLEAERSTALLQNTLRTTGYAAGLTANDIEELVGELSKISGFDDDPIREGTTALLRFKGVAGDTFREAAKLAVDFASATGKDLPSAFVAVGKALQNPVTGMRALRDAGADLSEGQAELAGKLAETGRVAESNQIVLSELARTVGGSAASAGGGLAGATRALSNAWDDLLKNIGRTATVSAGARGGLDALTGGLSFANRLLAQPDTELTGTIRVPGQTAPRPTIGRLSEAEALALQRAEGPQVRIAEPKKSDPAAAKRAAAEAKARYEAEYQQALAAGKAFSDQELQQLNEAADKKIRLEEEVNAEKIRILQEGAEAAAKLQQKQEAFVQSTGAGQLNALRERSRQLTQALDVGLIDEAGYDAELKKIGDEMAKLQLDGNAAFKDLKETGKDTLKDLEFAIQGWGRQASAAFADMVVSGTASFEDLRDVAKNVVRDILAMVVQKNILDPAIKAGAAVLGNVFSSITGGGSSGGGGGGMIGLKLPVERDAGGPGFAGQAYVINPRAAPEIFVPRTTGTFYPNANLGGSINITNYIDSRSDVATISAVTRASERRIFDELAKRR